MFGKFLRNIRHNDKSSIYLLAIYPKALNESINLL